MNSFRTCLFREEGGRLYLEATVTLHHLIAPQFTLDPKSSLLVGDAMSLLEMAGQGANGVKLKADLVKFTFTPEPPSQAPETV